MNLFLFKLNRPYYRLPVQKLIGIYMNFEHFPSDLFPLVMSFILRDDWKTCRKHEADCITQANRWASRVLDDDALDWYSPGIPRTFPIMFSQIALDTILDWSLFGRWFLIQLTRDNEYWYDSRMYPVKRGSSEYRMWYKQEFHWVQNSWRGIYSR